MEIYTTRTDAMEMMKVIILKLIDNYGGIRQI